MALTVEENELLTRVGPGTPMGELFRRYWIPALLSEEIAEPDSAPVRVRLLGEDLVAFRDTNGKVGLLAEKCAHRRTSLFYARNEECGLRCIYHGWKYDTEGNIIDTPAEPADSRIKHHVKQTAYPTYEVNGVIMAYMGPAAKMPLVPNFEWITLPTDHVTLSKVINDCNWLQAVEGDCDSSHSQYLHRRANDRITVGGTLELRPGYGEHLGWELEQGPWYVTGASHRYVLDGYKYVRTNTFIPPCMGLPPSGGHGSTVNGMLDGLAIKYQVPIDDYTTARFDIFTRRSAPWARLERRNQGDVGSDFRKHQNRSNDYLIDREKQRTSIFSGIDGTTHIQDACATETMGAISDREHEHLGTCDTLISMIRQFLLQALRDVQEGRDPPVVAYDVAANVFDQICSVDALLPLDVPWNDREQVMTHAIDSMAALMPAGTTSR